MANSAPRALGRAERLRLATMASLRPRQARFSLAYRSTVGVVMAVAAVCCAQAAGATTLMVEDNAVLSDRGLVSPDAGITPELVETGYDVAELMGARMIRYHRGLEPERADALEVYFARVDLWLSDVERRGLQPYLTLTYQPELWALPPPGPEEEAFVERYGAFCGEVAARYAGRIRHYGVWNEPNNGTGGGGFERRPRLYNVLFGECAAAIRAADPAAKVNYGEIDAHRAGACEYVDRSLTRPTVADGLAIHTYQWTTPPERPFPGSSECQGIGRLDDWNLARRAWAERGMLVEPNSSGPGDDAPPGGSSAPDAGRPPSEPDEDAPPGGSPASDAGAPAGGTASGPPLWITEHGYCAPAGECPKTTRANALDDATRADYARRAFAWASRKGVEVLGYYHLFSQRPAPELWDSGIVLRPFGAATATSLTPSVLALRQAVADHPDTLRDHTLFHGDPFSTHLDP